MRFQRTNDRAYTLWLSARDTRDWARKPGAAWPCSTLCGHAVRVDVDANGLCDMTVDSRAARDDIDGSELAAIVADHIPAGARHLWPTWGAETDGAQCREAKAGVA